MSNLLAMVASVSPDLTLYVRSRSLPSGTEVSTATGLSSVPSSRNGPWMCAEAPPRATGSHAQERSGQQEPGRGDRDHALVTDTRDGPTHEWRQHPRDLAGGVPP